MASTDTYYRSGSGRYCIRAWDGGPYKIWCGSKEIGELKTLHAAFALIMAHSKTEHIKEL